MTPKEKAIELVDKYYWTFGDGYLGEQHIQCALIAVQEIIKALRKDLPEIGLGKGYWASVKQEIEKL
jgi:hypothetical protein